MNNLSWLIYGAEVLGSAGILFEVAAFLSGLGIVIACGAIACVDDPDDSWERPLRYLWITAACALVAVAIPSRATIYMIAASEAGEQIAENPQARGMATDLGRLIQQKLDEALSDNGRGN